ncbi:MAG: BMP family protein [Gemmatimonadota bacterium]|nr:BMP family protein [Gemmatimonadota bacterium]MDH3423238.1 BMP family protein [Gemmatimonadota bacterium]
MSRNVRTCLLSSLVALVGCGGSSASDDGSLRAALLTSGPVSDAGWYAGAYDGLLLIQDSLGATISHQQTATPAEFDEAFLAYASSGYDLIFAHGFEYQDAAVRAGSQFPDVTIVVSGGGRIADNVVPLIFRLEEGSYLAGMAAAAMSETGMVGMVGGVAIPPAQGTFRAFEAGARSIDPDIRVLETFTGDWNDVAAAKEATVAQLSRGADVIIHNVDAASFGVFQAVREAAADGRTVWAVGMNSDQNDVAPDVIIGSAVIRIPQAFLETARRWETGEVGGAPIYASIREGVIDFVFNPRLMDRVPSGIVERIAAARSDIRSGALTVPRVRFVEDEVGAP